MSEDRASTRNSKPEKPDGTKHPKKKIPKKITETYLHNAGLYYLERFSSSSGNFRAVMLRKVARSCMAHPDQNYEICASMVDALTAKFVNVGLLDDTIYTRAMVTSLRRRGKSARDIQNRLRSKGLPADLIKTMLDALDAENADSIEEAEYNAALTFARKKRIGPYRGAKEPDPQKELGCLARAGFSYDTSRRVLGIDMEDSLRET